jgi:hypothetical protein
VRLFANKVSPSILALRIHREKIVLVIK